MERLKTPALEISSGRYLDWNPEIQGLVRVTALLRQKLLMTSDNESGFVAKLRSQRLIAMILVGFWGGLDNHALAALQVEDVILKTRDLYIKTTDRHCPALNRLCPVTAYKDWVTLAHVSDGAVFRRVSAEGEVQDRALHPLAVFAEMMSIFNGSLTEEPEGDKSTYTVAGHIQSNYWRAPEQERVSMLQRAVGLRTTATKSSLTFGSISAV